MPFELLPSLVAVLATLIPGMALAFGLMFGTHFSRLDKAVIGAMIGVVAIPMVAFLEYLLLGWNLTAGLVLANGLLLFLAGLGAYYLQARKFTLRVPEMALDMKTAKKYGPALFVLLMMAVAFYVRFVPGSTTTFYEFDPYYYMKLTQGIVTQGHLAMFTDDSFYPQQQFQHWPPLEHYLTAGWTLMHQMLTGQGYDQDVLILVSGIYPPLVGALTCFAAFLIIREEYNAYYGAVAAAMYALMHQLIVKFGAGVTEQQPFGMFMLLLFFMALMLALRRNSYRLGALTAVVGAAMMASSQQFIWPLMIFIAFMAIQSLLYFVSNDFEKRKMAILALAAIGFLMGNTMMAAYQNQQYVQYLNGETIMVIASLAFSLLLFFASGYLKDRLHTKRQRLGALGALGLAALILAAVTPVGQIAAGRILSYTTIALNTGSVSKTIAENGAPTAELYQSAYGPLNPPVLLLSAALVLLLSAAVLLFSKKHLKWGAATLLLGLSLLFFKGAYEAVFKTILGSGPAILLTFIHNDVFGFLVVGLASTALIYLFSAKEQRTESTLMMVLLFFPVAFIASNQLKYLLHLGFVLALAFPYLLGEIQRLGERLNEWFSLFSNAAAFRTGMLAVLLFVGALATVAQAQGVQSSMDELAGTRLPDYWTQTFQWMRTSAPADARIMSWWDYGHWTTFLGQRKTVLNPSNNYEEYDHDVARAFVNGNPDDLYTQMEFHHATHVMVDVDLVGKWGALVYLSGTCKKTDAAICPSQPEIDPKSSPGQSHYEAEHYFEYLTVTGNCPASAIGIPLPAVQSSFGARYCMTNDQMIYLDGQGTMSNITRNYKLVGRDAVTTFDSNTSYLFPASQNQFININPYFEPFGLHNSVFQAAFTQMFFLGQYPGFKQVFSTPDGKVKIFEYTGRPSSSTSTPSPTATPTASANASASTTPTPDAANAVPSSVAEALSQNASG